MVELVVVGTDFQLAPLSALQDLVLRREEVFAHLLALQQQGELRGAALLTTCNRVEILLEGIPSAAVLAAGPFGELPIRELRGVEAVTHALCVATGIRSLVRGEEQILGQLSRAFQESESHGLMSKGLHMLRTRILASARHIRQRTGLAGCRVSAASVAARRLSASARRVAVVGVGEMGRQALDEFARLGVREVLVVNRTRSTAERVASHYGFRTCSLEAFRRHEPEVDGVLLAISSREAVVSEPLARRLRIVVDLGMPSALGPEFDAIPGLTVVRLDGIGELAGANAGQLLAAAALAEKLVPARAARIQQDLDTGRVNLASVIERHVSSAREELERAFRGNLAHLSDRDRASLRQVLDRLVRRSAHYHIKDLKELVGL